MNDNAVDAEAVEDGKYHILHNMITSELKRVQLRSLMVQPSTQLITAKRANYHCIGLNGPLFCGKS